MVLKSQQQKHYISF